MMQFRVKDRVRVRDDAPIAYDMWRGKVGTIVGLSVVRGSFGFRGVGEGFDTTDAARGTAHLVQFDEGQGTHAIDEQWLSNI